MTKSFLVCEVESVWPVVGMPGMEAAIWCHGYVETDGARRLWDRTMHLPLVGELEGAQEGDTLELTRIPKGDTS